MLIVTIVIDTIFEDLKCTIFLFIAGENFCWTTIDVVLFIPTGFRSPQKKIVLFIYKNIILLLGSFCLILILDYSFIIVLFGSLISKIYLMHEKWEKVVIIMRVCGLFFQHVLILEW